MPASPTKACTYPPSQCILEEQYLSLAVSTKFKLTCEPYVYTLTSTSIWEVNWKFRNSKLKFSLYFINLTYLQDQYYMSIIIFRNFHQVYIQHVRPSLSCSFWWSSPAHRHLWIKIESYIFKVTFHRCIHLRCFISLLCIDLHSPQDNISRKNYLKLAEVPSVGRV